MHFIEQKYKLIKTEWNRIWKIPSTTLERQTLCFSPYKNSKLKVKLMSWRSHKKKEGIFCTFLCIFCSKEISLRNVFYLNVYYIKYTFWIYILLHVKNLISYTFFACFENGQKPSKVFIKEVREGIACSTVLLPFPIAIVSSRCE